MIRSEATVSRSVLAGRYRLLGLLGEGGMSRVWLARDEVLDRDVAAKEMVGSFDSWSRTIREAQAAARLTHPNVVRIYDVVQAGGRPWIVMEYVPSRSLEAVVAEEGPLSPARAAAVGIAVLDGLVAAHRAGVLHRDVKPQNVLVAADGRILLGDFGVAAFDDAGEITRERTPLGSPLFVAPERVRDGTSTVHTDMWSFGATLYWMVEGRPPYARASMAEQLSAVQREPPDPMRRCGALGPTIAGLLVREPAQRLTATIVRNRLTAIAEPDDAAAILGEPEPETEPFTVGRASLLEMIDEIEVPSAVPSPPTGAAALAAPPSASVGIVKLTMVDALRHRSAPDDDAEVGPRRRLRMWRRWAVPPAADDAEAGTGRRLRMWRRSAGREAASGDVVTASAAGATATLTVASTGEPTAAERTATLTVADTGGATATLTVADTGGATATLTVADAAEDASTVEPRRRLRARRRAAVVALAGALALATGAALLVMRDRPSVAGQFVPAPSASPVAMPLALGCDVADTQPAALPPGGPLVPGQPGSTLLQEGWVWPDEAAGYRIGVPGNWRRATAGDQVCFRDPAGRRRLTVQTGAPIDPDRAGAWIDAEKDLLAGDPPAGYHRVDIAAVNFRGGGADWEYTYEAGGETWHVLRRSFAVDALRAYVLTWTTLDEEWVDAQPDFRAAATSFDAPPL